MAFYLVAYQKLGYNERVERSGCRERLQLLSLFRQFNPLGTFDLTTSKHTLPYFVLSGIGFRKGEGGYYPQKQNDSPKWPIRPTILAAAQVKGNWFPPSHPSLCLGERGTSQSNNAGTPKAVRP